MIPDFEQVVVTLNQSGQHGARPQIDFLRARRNLDGTSRPHLDDALALNHDHLIARQPVGLTIEQLRSVNYHYLLTLSSEPRSTESECE